MSGRYVAAVGAVLLAWPGGAAAEGCQALSPGVNTLKGVLAEAGAQYTLRLERPLCGGGGQAVDLTFTGGDPRRFIGRRVLVSGTLEPARAGRGPVLQVGSFAPLPQVAANVS
ncbi:hypothetical protein [Phenylobacterium sp.]|jgi:hypothetical protein|uniref:hypothetical protein n=1 Tax=Phenylobacterium sp. TaxID=1871053 RepID=UPI002E33D8EE|nr:hypothetical protein [Phenylobacterium sp.]HEX2560147.1 hypothetical protein [Phenylobacterium sp.]